MHIHMFMIFHQKKTLASSAHIFYTNRVVTTHQKRCKQPRDNHCPCWARDQTSRSCDHLGNLGCTTKSVETSPQLFLGEMFYCNRSSRNITRDSYFLLKMYVKNRCNFPFNSSKRREENHVHLPGTCIQRLPYFGGPWSCSNVRKSTNVRWRLAGHLGFKKFHTTTSWHFSRWIFEKKKGGFLTNVIAKLNIFWRTISLWKTLSDPETWNRISNNYQQIKEFQQNQLKPPLVWPF